MSVRKKLMIQRHVITVSLNEGVVHIIGDDELRSLLKENLYAGTTDLIREIKKEYAGSLGKELQIRDKSLEAELWGHVYCEFFFQDLYRLAPLKPVGKLYRFVKFHCTVIDSGEKRKDSNRVFWNLVSPGRKWIAAMLKQRLRKWPGRAKAM